MEKFFKYPKRYYLFIPILVIILFPLSKGLIYGSFPVENYAFSIISISLVLFFLYLVFIIWQSSATVVKTTSKEIAIKKPFKSISLKWNDIFEFGRFRKVSYTRKCGYWCFYIKSREIDATRIIVATEDIKDVRALLATTFLKASNAKFVTVCNLSKIPFHKNIEVIGWDKNEDLSQYG
jgi:hypothetical protein